MRDAATDVLSASMGPAAIGPEKSAAQGKRSHDFLSGKNVITTPTMPVTEKTKDHLSEKSKRGAFPNPSINRILSRINAIPCSCFFTQSHSSLMVKLYSKVMDDLTPSPGGKILSRPHLSGSDQARYSGAKPGDRRDPGHSPLRSQLDCKSQHWIERQRSS